MKRFFAQLVQDEQGSFSSARVLLWTWSLFSLVFIVWTWREAPNAVYAFLSGVEIALIAWAGGARIAQYLGPQVGAAANAVGQSLREAVAKRRDPSQGVEVSR
jgi:Ca2+/H+ antiporter